MIKIKPDKEGFLTQWDIDRKVVISGLDGIEGVKVHFASPDDDHGAYVVDPVEQDGTVYADVPNILLTEPGRVDVFVYTTYTRVRAALMVFPREKPDDYVYTETEVLNFRKLANDIGNTSLLETQAKSLVGAVNEVAGKVADYKLLSESTGISEPVAFLEFTNLAGYNDFILTYTSPRTTDSSGIMLYINGNQVSTGQGSYFMKSNDTRNGIIKIKCNLPDGHYRLEGSAQTINQPYNQDVIFNGDGQMRLGDDGVINSIKIGLTKTTSAIPAQTTFKFYGRYINA